MNVNLHAPSPLRPNASSLSLEQLAANPTVSKEEKIAEAARQFESILLRQILTDIRKPVIRSKLETNNTANGIYTDLVNHNLADSISRSGMLGLAESLKKELTHQTLGRPGNLVGSGAEPSLKESHD